MLDDKNFLCGLDLDQERLKREMCTRKSEIFSIFTNLFR